MVQQYTLITASFITGYLFFMATFHRGFLMNNWVP